MIVRNIIMAMSCTLYQCHFDVRLFYVCLQEDVKIVKTPPCFSLGMDDWLTDIEYDHDHSDSDTRKSCDPLDGHVHTNEHCISSQDFSDSFLDDDIELSQDRY